MKVKERRVLTWKHISLPNNTILIQIKIKTHARNSFKFKKPMKFYQMNRNVNNTINLDMDLKEQVVLEVQEQALMAVQVDPLVVVDFTAQVRVGQDFQADLIQMIFLVSSLVVDLEAQEVDLQVREDLVALLEPMELIHSVA